MTNAAEVIARYKTDYHLDPAGLSLRATAPDGEAITLRPLQASRKHVSEEDVALLTAWRNQNRHAFLTDFSATEQGTWKWVTAICGADPTRILFMIDGPDGRPFGHVGLCNLRAADRYAELDNIVRGRDAPKGAMRAAATALCGWARAELGIEHFCVRVMADNPAVAFYEKLGFRRVRDVPLEYRRAGGVGHWMEQTSGTAPASRYLRYMERAA